MNSIICQMQRFVEIVAAILLLTLVSNLDDVNGQKCGTVEILDGTILGGMETKRGEWPFIAALFYTEQSKYFCGSTLISSKHVLTAAHCMHPKSSSRNLHAEDIIVLLGKHNLSRIERGSAMREVAQIIIHPDWKVYNDRYDADIAILVFTEQITFSNLIRPICMPDPELDKLMDDTEARIVGWGVGEQMQHEIIPLQGTTLVLNDSYCYTNSPTLAALGSIRTFCGGGGKGGAPNSGDSGGGLFVLSDATWVQYGIISSSLTDARGQVLGNSSSLYTEVPSFLNWIMETVEASGGVVLGKGDKRIDKRIATRIPTRKQTDYVDEITVGYADFSCTYENSPDGYKCYVDNANLTRESLRVGSVGGKHLYRLLEKDVQDIWFRNGTLNYIPDGLGKLFKNIQRMWVFSWGHNLKLKALKRRNFRDMPKLWYLDVQYNEVESIEEHSLRDLPNLKYFIINNNKLKRIDKLTFAANFNLLYVDAQSNQIEALPRELFINNPLIEHVSFSDNKLVRILADFTNFNYLKHLDFRGNVCIDKVFLNNVHHDVSQFAEYQGCRT